MRRRPSRTKRPLSPLTTTTDAGGRGRSLRDECRRAGVPYFLKQIEVDGKLVSMPELDGTRHAQSPEGMA